MAFSKLVCSLACINWLNYDSSVLRLNISLLNRIPVHSPRRNVIQSLPRVFRCPSCGLTPFQCRPRQSVRAKLGATEIECDKCHTLVRFGEYPEHVEHCMYLTSGALDAMLAQSTRDDLYGGTGTGTCAGPTTRTRPTSIRLRANAGQHLSRRWRHMSNDPQSRRQHNGAVRRSHQALAPGHEQLMTEWTTRSSHAASSRRNWRSRTASGATAAKKGPFYSPPVSQRELLHSPQHRAAHESSFEERAQLRGSGVVDRLRKVFKRDDVVTWFSHLRTWTRRRRLAGAWVAIPAAWDMPHGSLSVRCLWRLRPLQRRIAGHRDRNRDRKKSLSGMCPKIFSKYNKNFTYIFWLTNIQKIYY